MDTNDTDDEQEVIDQLYDELKEQTRMVQSTRQLLTTLAARRREVTRELANSGQTYRQIAERLGVSKSAIQQILS